MRSADAIEQFLADRIARGCRPATLTYYKFQLERLPPELPTQPGQLRAILAGVGGAPVSRHDTYRALRALYRFAIADELVDGNPMARVAPPRVPKIHQRTLDRGDVVDLLDLDLSDRDRAIISLILDSGLRSGELRALRGRDLHDGWIEANGKTGAHPVPVHESTSTQLHALARGNDQPIFHTVDGRPLSRWRVYSIVRSAIRRAGLDHGKSGPHCLRHTFGRHYIESRGSMPALQEIMGHASITTTAIYTHLATRAVKEEHDEASQLTQEPKKKIRRVV